MLWMVFNDIADIHAETNGQPLGVEVQMMVYAFACEDNKDLNHTNKSKHELCDDRALSLHVQHTNSFGHARCA